MFGLVSQSCWILDLGLSAQFGIEWKRDLLSWNTQS